MGLKINPITLKLDWYDPGVSVLGDPVTPAHGGTGTSTVFTEGSIVFVGASGVYTEDNANLFFDNTNNRLGVGLSSPLAKLHVKGDFRVESASSATLYFKFDNSISGAFPRTTFQGGNSTADTNWIARFADAYSSSGLNIPVGLQVTTNNDASYISTYTTCLFTSTTKSSLYTSFGSASNGNKLMLGTEGTGTTGGIWIETVANSQRVGVNKETPLFQLHVKGTFAVESASSTTLYFDVDNSISTTFPRTFFRGGNSTSDTNWFMRFADAYSSSSLNIPAGIQISTNKDPSFTNAFTTFIYQTTTLSAIFTGSGAAGNGTKLQLGTDASAATGGLYIDTVTNGQRVGISVSSPTARLHLAAGSATASTAPLKLTSGAVLTVAEVGAVEFLTDDYLVTITTGAARKGVVLDDGSRLTSGRVPFATTNGRLVDDADMTFATDTLTVTKVVGSTSVKVGTAAGFISSDGSTGATGSFTTADAKTVTVKDGIITSIV